MNEWLNWALLDTVGVLAASLRKKSYQPELQRCNNVENDTTSQLVALKWPSNQQEPVV